MTSDRHGGEAVRSSPEAGSGPLTGLDAVLRSLRDGEIDLEQARERLRTWPYEDMAFARIDHHRALRGGFPEVVYCPGKDPEHAAAVMARLADEHGLALATRADAVYAEAIARQVPDARYESVARMVVVDRRPDDAAAASQQPAVAVVSAGTADQPIAEEAVVTATVMGCAVSRTYDAGVAGVHRLLDSLPALGTARAIVVVAGMEGALPGVVAGLVRAPVIAVPTSVGYGAHLGGIAPLLTMLNSCAPGMAVVNIDAGFSAGYMAASIALQATDAPVPVGTRSSTERPGTNSAQTEAGP